MSDTLSIGLYPKYRVTRKGKPVDGFFLLRPATDRVALKALVRYAELTDSTYLRDDLWQWIEHIRSQQEGNRRGNNE